MIDKPVREVRFGEAPIQNTIEANNEVLSESSLVGVRFITDDPILHSNFLEAEEDFYLPTLKRGKPALYYLTQSPLPFLDKDGTPLIRMMTIEDLGEIYTTYDLRSFAFAGAGLFGIASSLVYGIRSFCGIEDGLIGLHSSCIYDRKRSLAFILVGDGTLGKSTVSSMVEVEAPDRFVMVSDDWNEFDMNNGVLRPVSTIYSNKIEDERSPNYRFTSYGKKFYKRTVDTPHEMKLGGIIEVLPGGYGLDTDVQTFIQISMGHIPFISAKQLESNAVSQLHQGNAMGHLTQLIQYKRDLYHKAYLALRNDLLIGRIVNDKSIDTPITSIRDYVLSRIL
ncbi:MAG: hypothetical protein KatS3mg085_749 [Candidatus Dojkabacteria bacterium]|nr:MAG: hypothetical protein KatS3mg085_749 [Candidatus Dojkabacteria bacterium]